MDRDKNLGNRTGFPGIEKGEWPVCVLKSIIKQERNNPPNKEIGCYNSSQSEPKSGYSPFEFGMQLMDQDC
jgi:hypothetical protein